MLTALIRGSSPQHGLFAMYNIKFVISNACIKLKETAWVKTHCCELQLMKAGRYYIISDREFTAQHYLFAVV